ncbi:MAG: Kelch repeat-containing protein, partial [Planctomycetota bacterium]
MALLNSYRIGLFSVGLVAVVALGSGSAKADYIWTQKKADMPTPRWALATAVVNGKTYAIGGKTSEPGATQLSTVEVYDPATDTWTRKADMPTARAYLSASAVGDKIYAIGGHNGITTVQEYDPATDTWIQKADMSTGRSTPATCVVNGKIYAIGGAQWILGQIYSTIHGVSSVEVYDPTTDTWISKSDMPMGVWGLCAFAINGKIYALGGRPRVSAMPYTQEYDPATDTWTRKADMPVATSNMAAAVLGDKIIVIGGWLSSGNYPYTAVQMYDPETDTWTIERDAPFLRAAVSASVVNNRIYVIGGTDRPHPCLATSTVYELTIDFPPDFNGDFNIDIDDLVILIEHWGQDEPSVDIAPPPSGDGIVDVQDLELFMSYWGQESLNPSLIAQWKLDETEGDIVYDSAGYYDGTCHGQPLWQP